MYVGLLGGLLGVAAGVSGGVAVVVTHFATQEQLRIVDCYQYYNTESLKAQIKHNRLFSDFQENMAKAAEAEARHMGDRTNVEYLKAHKEAARVYDEEYAKLKRAQNQSFEATKEAVKCGHQGPEQLQSQ